MSPSAQEEFADVRRDDEYDSVILGLHPPSLSYEPFNKAFRILKREPISHSQSTSATSEGDQRTIPLIAPHASLFQQSQATDDLPEGLSLGIGPFVRALEVAAGVEAELVGKPTRRFFELGIERLRELYGDVQGDIGVVGDDVVNDLGDGARDIGLKRILGECNDRVMADFSADWQV
jgi:ribonucleotide monophosphatase NagD (HAD superfamily)